MNPSHGRSGYRDIRVLMPATPMHLFRRLDGGMLTVVLVFLALLPLSIPRIYATDEIRYYVYVRSLYFDGDLDFRNEFQHFADVGLQNGDPAPYNALIRDLPDDPPIHPETGMARNVAPIGASLLWAPGVIIADIGVRGANMMGSDTGADGYSAPYIWAICLLSAAYVCAGLVLTYRLARRFVSGFSATLATITVWLASPLVFYTYIAMPWAHGIAFFLVALFFTLWLRDWDVPLMTRLAERPLWVWAALGAVGGVMTMTREQMALFLLLPVLEWLWGGWASWRRLTAPLVFGITFILTIIPQLVTYQVLNGRPMPDTVVSGKLASSGGISPHFFDTLIHPAHGAFLWSPVLALGLLGLFWLARSDRLLAVLLGIGFLVQTYLNGSFGTTWHLSGAFGFRRLIECTPIFVLGLAALIEWLRPRTGQLPLLIIACLLIYWNAGLIAQWTVVRPEMRTGLHWDGMIYYQFVEVPKQVAGKLSALLFDRCQLMQNC